MPWDPKPVPPVVQQQPQQVQQHHQQQQPQPIHNAGLPNPGTNGMPPASYGGYQNNVPAPSNGAGRIKTEPGMDQQQQPQQQQQQQQYHGLPPMSSYSQINGAQGGGAVRAQQLVEQQFGPGATAGFQRGGLALPGQQNAKPQPPQGLQLPPNNPQQMQNQYQQQQHQAMQQRQQQQLNQQQQNPQIKVEGNNNQNGTQNQYQQQPTANYSQTDGADDALEEWRAMLAERRVIATNQTERADRMMRERISALSDELQSGLMLPLDEQQGRLQARNRKAAALKAKRAAAQSSTTGTSSMPKIAQLDGDAGDDDEDEDAINSDLDDPEDETNQINDDDDDNGDTILCTYDKVQRVKNKWKCTLKDGVLNANGKEWLFHKGNGEFEW
jgi:transcription initiation factor TFIIA large subunit